MLHGGPASVAWFISVNSSEAHYKTLRAENNRRNENISEQKKSAGTISIPADDADKMNHFCAAACGAGGVGEAPLLRVVFADYQVNRDNAFVGIDEIIGAGVKDCDILLFVMPSIVRTLQ